MCTLEARTAHSMEQLHLALLGRILTSAGTWVCIRPTARGGISITAGWSVCQEWRRVMRQEGVCEGVMAELLVHSRGEEGALVHAAWRGRADMVRLLLTTPQYWTTTTLTANRCVRAHAHACGVCCCVCGGGTNPYTWLAWLLC